MQNQKFEPQCQCIVTSMLESKSRYFKISTNIHYQKLQCIEIRVSNILLRFRQKLQSNETIFQIRQYTTMQNFNSIKRVIAEIQACDSSA